MSRLLRMPPIAFAFLAVLAGCRNEMYDQPRYEPMEASDFFEDGTSARTPVNGTVARGQAQTDSHLYEGKVDGKLVETFPFEIDEATLKRGAQRFQIFCSPCHSSTGDGDGMIVRRGFPPPPSFHKPKADPKGAGKPIFADLRTAPVGHFFDVITNGYGVMYSYAARVSVRDRWAIIAYIRALQLSQHAEAKDLSPEDREQLEKAASKTPAPKADSHNHEEVGQ